MNDAAFDELTEEIVFQIRQSRAVQLARVQAYLDGLVLAAEQVQDVRLKHQETPPAVSGWEAAGSLLLTFALDSTIAGKLLAKTAQVIFTPILRMNSVFRALPKSTDGKQLVEQALKLAQLNHPFRYDGLSASAKRLLPSFRRVSEARAQTISAVLQGGAGGVPGLKALDKQNVVLYHAWLDAVIKANSASEKNFTAAAKTVRAAAKMSLESAPLPTGNSPGVDLRAAAYDYATVTSLGIQFQHDRFETLVRGRNIEPAALEKLIALFQWEDLDTPEGAAAAAALSRCRREFALLFEAIIWARLYGFKRPYAPAVTNNLSYLGIDQRHSDYWLERFASAVAPRWNISVDKWKAQSTERRLFQLREYYWDIVERMPRL